MVKSFAENIMVQVDEAKRFRGLGRVEMEGSGAKKSWKLMFPRLIPSPFYTRRCLCARAGTRPAAGFPTRCRGHRCYTALPTNYGGSDGRDR